MSFLSTIGGLGAGFVQGADVASNIKSRAMQIQQAQFNLDQQKRELMGHAQAFQSFLQPTTGGAGPGGIPQMQPQGPGQAQGLPPINQPGVGQTPSPGPGQPAPSGYSPGGTGAPPAPMAGPQPPMPGQPSVPMQPPQGQPQQPPSGGLPDQLSTQGQIQILQTMAQRINQAMPEASPEQKFEALKDQIGLIGSLSQTQKSDLATTLQLLRGSQRSDQIAQKGDIDAARDEQKAADKLVQIRLQGQYSLQGRQLTANAAMSRAQFIQGQLTKRFSAGQIVGAQKTVMEDRVRAITAQLNQATRELTSLKDQTGQPLPDDDPRVKSAKARIKDANMKLDIVAKNAKIDVPDFGEDGGGAAPAGGKPDPLGLR